MRRKTASLFWNDNDLVEAIPLAMDTNEESDNEVTIYAADVVVSAPAITWWSGSCCGNLRMLCLTASDLAPI